MVDVTIMLDAEELIGAAEAEEGIIDEWRHMLADQALLAKLRPSAPDFVQRYERLEEDIDFEYSF